MNGELDEHYAVWGLGYIGLTTTDALLRSGARVVGIDTDHERLAEVARGPVVLNAISQTRVDLTPALANGRLTLRSGPRLGHWPLAHFVSVPTESSGTPTRAPFDAVLRAIDESGQPGPNIIVESTLSPDWVTPDLLSRNLALAPRRDWFHDPGHTLSSLSRILGASNPEMLAFARKTLERISTDIVVSDDAVAVAATKCFENSIWYLVFSYVNELAIRAPGTDVNEVLRLAATNWRTPFPLSANFGVGGYCLPLSARYLDGYLPDGSPILQAATSANEEVTEELARRILDSGAATVLVLGLTYRPGLAVITGSAGSRLIERLRGSDVRVLAHDPLIPAAHVERLPGARACDPFETDHDAECVVIATDHPEYTEPTAMSRVLGAPRLRRVYATKHVAVHLRRPPSGVEVVTLGSPRWEEVGRR